MKAISGKKVLWQVVVVVAASILWTWGMVRPDDASAVTDACKLLSAGEIEAVVGGKVGRSGALETTEMCQMMAGTYFVTVRRFAKKDADTKHASEGIEKAKKMGIKMTEEKHGNTTCSTAIGNSRTPAYITGCTVDKGGVIVGVEVMSPSEAQMVPVSKLRPLAEKAAGRL
ncbi:MAG: hypothetical protein HZC12_08250 [Nitrospirae bacterium]|nr:hypothetical protein [Nitrospirota bacterium]